MREANRIDKCLKILNHFICYLRVKDLYYLPQANQNSTVNPRQAFAHLMSCLSFPSLAPALRHGTCALGTGLAAPSADSRCRSLW